MKRKILSILLVMLLAVMATALVACDSPIELDKPANVRYDGSTITWDAVENASSYTVAINEGEAYPVTTNRFPYAAKGQSFSVKITAVSGAEKIVSSGETTMMFFPLAAITDLTIASDGTVSWPAVENATAYEINVDNVVVDTVSTLSYSGLAAGTHSIKVRPVVQGDNSYYSSWSPAESMTVLSAVAKSDITYVNGDIRWKYVSGAQYYEVRVNGNVIAEKSNTTSIPYNADNTNFEVTVKALGNGTTTYDGATSEAKEFVFLGTVSNIRVEDGILKWDEVPGADCYKLELNETVQNNTYTTLEYTGLNEGVDTRIRIMPVSNDTAYFSDWSAVQTFRILKRPVLTWNDYELDGGDPNNNVVWDLVANAVGYSVKLVLPNGTEVIETYGATDKDFAYQYLSAGDYTVQVKAVAPNTGNLSDSPYSDPIYVTRLASPERADTNFIKSNPTKVTDGFTVTFKGVQGAAKYELYQDNNLAQTGTSQQFVVGNLVGSGTTEQQTYNYKIRAIGNYEKVGNNTYVRLSSLTSEALSFDITVLAVPANPSISGYTYSYGEIANGYGYSIDISGSSTHSNTTSLSLETLQVGNYQVSVCAQGNGAEVLASNYTYATTVYRLAAPTNVKILTSDASEGVLTYDQILFATGYEIIFDNSENAVPVTDMMNINQYITEQGTTVCMQSIANYYDAANHSIYYMTSPRGVTVNFIKLATPTFGDVSFTNDQFIWKPSSNVNATLYTPTYEVYYADGSKYNGEKNGNTMDISYLEGGQSYTFYVKAIGNGTSFINSGMSAAISIYKLSSPVVTRSEGQYVWGGVVNATGYAIYVDGVLAETYTHESGKVYRYTPKFDEIKNYTVEVFAIGDGGYVTIDSDPAVLEQTVKQLETPEFSMNYSHPSGYSTSGTIDLAITKESPYAKGYSYTVGGATSTSYTAKTYSHLVSSVGKYTASVYALGGNFDEAGVYYIDSQRRGGNSSYEITLLDITNVSSISLTRDGYLDWADSSLGAHLGYTVVATVNGVTTTYDKVANSNLTLSGVSGGVTVHVTIKANGNGQNIIASETVEWQLTLAQ